MPDEPSLGELGRRQDRAEQDHRTDIAQVRTEHADDIRKLREDVINPALVRIAALEKVNATRPTMSFTKWIGVLGVVVGFLAVVVTVWATSRGAK